VWRNSRKSGGRRSLTWLSRDMPTSDASPLPLGPGRGLGLCDVDGSIRGHTRGGTGKRGFGWLPEVADGGSIRGETRGGTGKRRQTTSLAYGSVRTWSEDARHAQPSGNLSAPIETALARRHLWK